MPILRVQSVDIGARGAIRRLLRGLAPRAALQILLQKIPPRTIPWSFVDLIETDPARRIKLKISHDGLATLHPADIADIVEDLAPDEREAVFRTLDEDVAAETLEEVEPKVQKSIVESLDSERAADIVEEMDPDAAADLLGDLSAGSHRANPGRDGARGQPGGRRTPRTPRRNRRRPHDHRVPRAPSHRHGRKCHRRACASSKAAVESVSTIYLVDSHGTLAGAVPLVKLVLAQPTPRCFR